MYSLILYCFWVLALVFYTTTFPNLQFVGVPTSLPLNVNMQGILHCLERVIFVVFGICNVPTFQKDLGFFLELLGCKVEDIT